MNKIQKEIFRDIQVIPEQGFKNLLIERDNTINKNNQLLAIDKRGYTICPECGSKNVKYFMKRKRSKIPGYYSCKDCCWSQVE